ncbi:MAG: aldo/keto reductase [Clostridiales Family XIII bacterium]|jgi:predicted aldo/keto reductase-like oxidoreductase|nr:aldo/keto reductase [Clostridiales Family XIII bacterium]
MSRIKLGKTGLVVEQHGFGALPIQRIPEKDAVYLLRKAWDGGMDFFDTARFYTNSEECVGLALADVRDKVVIATKTMALAADDFWEQLHFSLGQMKTDYVDIYQFHNPPFCPKPGGEDGLYDAALKAKEEGKIRFIGITNHRLSVANEAIDSGLYASLQFPFSYLAGEQDIKLPERCKEKGMALIAMKALAGGLITDSAAASAWLTQYDNVEAIWGIQKEKELDEFLAHMKNPPELTAERQAVIDADRAEISGEFCRACGYCLPCPVDIDIPLCARASVLLRRAPLDMVLGEEGQAKMRKVADCIECGTCSSRCPYGLDTPNLLKKNYQDFLEVLDGKDL